MRVLRALCLALGISFLATAAEERGLVETKEAKNKLFAVGVSHGLPGIDLDVNNVVKMAGDEHYKFEPTTLMDPNGTVANIAKGLTQVSSDVDNDGTFFFYYSGHGGYGDIVAEDRDMTIEEIRDAVVKGRKKKTPLQRLVMIFDSCHAGSLIGPLRNFAERVTPDFTDAERQSEMFVDAVVDTFSSSRFDDAQKYWQKLIVIASSTADESSLAGEDGSIFTVAMKKAFDESIAKNATVGEWIQHTKDYTVGHHPVERLVPESLAQESMY